MRTTESKFVAGESVCAGAPRTYDYDEGRVISLLASGDYLVAWQSGVRTSCSEIELRPGHEDAWPLQLEED